MRRGESAKQRSSSNTLASWGTNEIHVEAHMRYVAMAENKRGTSHHLEIQRALVDDDQARDLGQDTHCLVDELQSTHYGGVTRWHLDDGVLELELSPEAGEVMGAGAGYRIAVPKTDHRTVIRDALPTLLT